MKKTSRRFIGLLLVIALLVSLPVVSMAGDATDDLAVNNEVEDNLIIDGNDEIDDAPVVDEPVIDKTDDKPASLVVTNSVASMGNVVAQDAGDEDLVGKLIYDVFPDEGFAKLIYVEELKKTDEAKAIFALSGQDKVDAIAKLDLSKYRLTDEDVNGTSRSDRNCIQGPGNYDLVFNPKVNNKDDKENNFYGVESIEGIGHFKNLTQLQITQYTTYSKGTAGIKTIPEEINKLTKLNSIDLTYNQISSGIEHLYGLTNLVKINFMYNEIKEIPEGISNLSRLFYISFSFNQLKTIPSELYGMKNIRTFSFANNRIESIKGIDTLINYNKTVKILTNVSFANNRISDFSEMYGYEFAQSGWSQVLQVVGQSVIADKAITVTGTAATMPTHATVDIMDYQYKYVSSMNPTGGSIVAVYDKLDTDVDYNKWRAWPTRALPEGLTSESANATMVDRDDSKAKTTFRLPIKKNVDQKKGDLDYKGDYYVVLRMQAPKPEMEKPGSEEWTSFDNSDISYIIPITFVEEKPVVAGDDAVPPSSVLGEEAPADDEAKVLGEEAKTFDSMDWTLIAGVALIMLIGLAVLFRRREME